MENGLNYINMKLTKDQIEKINNETPYEQGVFREPFGIPSHIKGLVIYTSWESSSRGGSCWDDEHTVNEHNEYGRPSDCDEVLVKVLEILLPNVSALVLRKIDSLRCSNENTDYGYYGDYTENTIEWIELDKLIALLSE